MEDTMTKSVIAAEFQNTAALFSWSRCANRGGWQEARIMISTFYESIISLYKCICYIYIYTHIYLESYNSSMCKIQYIFILIVLA